MPEEFLYEVGDEFNGSQAQISKFIKQVYSHGGEVRIQGKSVIIVSLPVRSESVVEEVQVVKEYEEPVVEEVTKEYEEPVAKEVTTEYEELVAEEVTKEYEEPVVETTEYFIPKRKGRRKASDTETLDEEPEV